MKYKISPDEFNILFSNPYHLAADLIKPRELYAVEGRATGKTTDLQAKRSIDVIEDMPRATGCFIGNTYVNLLTNVIPSFCIGWEKFDFKEGIHWVADEKPPEHFKKPIVPAKVFKHTIHTYNGFKFILKSLDRPDMSAGISVQHLFGDEAKYLARQKMNKIFQTLRGDRLLFQDSPFFRGVTFTSDMPIVAQGESDFILDPKSRMNVKMLHAILQVALVLNELRIEYYKAEKSGANPSELENIERNIARWEKRYRNLRRLPKSTVMFMNVSSLANVDVLSFEYILSNFESLDPEEFNTSILSIESGIAKGARFYGKLNDRNIYSDGYNYEYYDKFGLRDNIEKNCNGLRYMIKGKPLEMGVDFGNMMSMVVGQSQDNIMRLLKCFHTLPPEWFRELADQFIKFFEPHDHKIVEVYFDRSGNNYQESKADMALQLKKAIEYDKYSKPTGWYVELMSRGQSNILHKDEYTLANQMMSELNPNLPTLLIDKFECADLLCSLRLAPLKPNAKNKIEKDKSSEKLESRRLPRESTNYSDAFKYFICRHDLLQIAKKFKY